MKYNLSKGLKAKYLEYLNSDTFKDFTESSKCKYWKLHASNLKITMKSDTIKAQGKSSFYAIPTSPIFIIRKIVLLLVSPLDLILRIKQVIGMPRRVLLKKRRIPHLIDFLNSHGNLQMKY